MKDLANIFNIEILFFLLIIIGVFNFVFTIVFFNIIKFKPKLFYPLDFLFYWNQIIQKLGSNQQAKKYLKIIIYLTVFSMVLSFILYGFIAN